MTKIILYAFSLCLTGCISISGFNSGYRKLSDENKQKIKYLENRDIDSLKNDGNVYLVNAGQLLDFIKRKERVLLYSWSPHCGADCCVTLDFIEKFCKDEGTELLVVMDYYNFEYIPDPAIFSKPVFFIDTKYYGTNLCFKYMPRFYKELTGISEKECNYGRHYYFVNGKFEGMYDYYVIEQKNSSSGIKVQQAQHPAEESIATSKPES